MNSLNYTKNIPLSQTAIEIEAIRKKIQTQRERRMDLVGKIITGAPNDNSGDQETPAILEHGEKKIFNSKYSRLGEFILYGDNVEVLYADAESFKTPFKNERYALDCKNVYISGMSIPGADPTSFSFYKLNGVDSVYATDHTGRIYCDCETLNLDKETFQIVSTKYAFDKNGVYNNGRKLSGEELKKVIAKYNIPISITERLKKILNTKVF